MDVILGLVLCFIILMFTVQKGIFLGYALLVCFLIFALIAYRKGNSLQDILRMSYEGASRSFLIFQLFMLIGCIMSVWISSGTLPTLMYYCLSYISPDFFLIFAFLSCSLVSFLIGSCFGAVSTMGIALITLAKSGNIPLALMAGAIMSGVYFGDRNSPVSSAAALTSSVCKADHLTFVKNMLFSTILPFLLSCALYTALSFAYPLKTMGSSLTGVLQSTFEIRPILLLPALILFLLPLLKVSVKLSLSVSIAVAFFFSVTVQGEGALAVLKGMLLGIHFTEEGLSGVLSSGGIRSMLTTYVMLFISCALAGIFEQIHAFDPVKSKLVAYNRSKKLRFGLTALVSTFSAAFGCNQTIATILTHDVMQPCYEEEESAQFSLDISNTALLISGLIPWCVASFVPAAMLGLPGVTYIPFAFYLYLVPLCSFLLFSVCGKAKYS